MSVKKAEGCALADALLHESTASKPTHVEGCAESNYVLFTIKIGNAGDILKNYGGVSMARVTEAVCSVIARFDESALVEPAADDQIRVSLPRERLAGDVSLAAAFEAWIGRVCRSVALIPFWTEWGVVHVWLTARWSSRIEGEDCGSDWLFGFFGEALPESEGAVLRYRRDMALGSKLLCALAGAEDGGLNGGGLRIVWRPVMATASCEVLYYQSIVQFEEAIGDPWLTRNALAVVERIGFGSIVDEIVLQATVAELEADEDVVLSAAVSSCGIVGSAWWARLAARLESRPETARRLVLEINEAAALAKSAEVGRFCDEARRLGCRIAISAFGAGFASVRQLVTLAPDIVKIDCGFVRRSATSPRDRAIMEGLWQLAAAVASTVVADGVDSFAQAQLADEMGLAWQQGHFWGEATACRPWGGVRGRRDMGRAPLAGHSIHQ